MRYLILVAILLLAPCHLAVGAKAQDYRGSTLKIGVVTINDADETYNNWRPLAHELETAIPGVKFDIVPFSYKNIEDVLKEGALHYVVLGPAYYVDMEVRHGISRLATIVRSTSSGPLYSMGGIILVGAGRNDLVRPQDLKGKNIAASDSLTIGGWLTPVYEYQRIGIEPGDFKTISFMSTYEAAVQAVQQGKADAAFVRTGTLEKLIQDGRVSPNEFKVLRFPAAPVGYPLEISTRSYPEWAFAKTLAAPEDLSKRVVLALLSMKSNSPLAKSAGIEGFAVPLDYGQVHEMMRSLKVGPYAVDKRAGLAETLHGHGIVVAGGALLLLLLGATAMGVAAMNRRLALSRSETLKMQGDLEGIVAARTRELEAEVERRRQAEVERLKESEKVKEALVKTVKAVALTVEMRDPYMSGHQQRVACLAQAIAEEMRLAPELVESIYLSGLVHDIGMIYVPSEITNRPGPLNELEYEIVKNHPRIGHDIMSTVDLPWPIAKIVLNHHRRLDGSGYPDDVEGEIPLEARILEVADVVEAMSSHRPYRPPPGIDKALREIEAGRGTKFDADVVDATIALVRREGARIWK